ASVVWLYFFSRGFDDLPEGARIETRAADERTVNVRLDHQRARVFRFHAAAVLDSNPLGGRFVRHFTQCLANERVRFLRLLRSCIAPSPDPPDPFVPHYLFLKLPFA